MGETNVDFRTLGVSADHAGQRLGEEVGDCNVFVRGVLHVLEPSARQRLASNIGDLVGVLGTLLIAETHYPGPLLGYLESLGACPTGVPRPLARAISAGLPRPSSFGDTELEDSFPPELWERLHADDHAQIATVFMGGPGTAKAIPGYLAVLRRRQGRSAPGYGCRTPRWCPRWDSNPHWTDFESAASADWATRA